MDKMNIFDKIQYAKYQLAQAKLKKSGKNKFADFEYFELSDFLPTVITLFNEAKLFSQVSFTSDTAILKIINIEKPDEAVEYTSPMRDLEIKGCNAMQALGGAETYQRRYLYMAALDITESDAIDATTGKSDEKTEQPSDKKNKDTTDGLKPTEAQLKRLYALRKSAKIDDNDTFARLLSKYCNGKNNDKDLNMTEYNLICDKLQEQANKTGKAS